MESRDRRAHHPRKDTVRRILAKHFRPDPSDPSWLTFLAHSKDSLWSVDFFRCESLILRTHWVMVVMDQFTRRINGLAVRPGVLDGPAVCRMFNDVLSRSGSLPQLLSSDHDPLFLFHRWTANLGISQIRQINPCPPFLSRIHSSSGSSDACDASSSTTCSFEPQTISSKSSPTSCATAIATVRTER